MSCNCDKQDFCVAIGATFNPIVQWAKRTLTTVPVSAISNSTPVTVTATGHGMPNNWPAAIVGVQGMTEINAPHYPPYTSELHAGTVVDANTVQFNDESSALWQPYLSGGALVYYTPQALAGMTFTMSFYASPDFSGTPLVQLSSIAGSIAVDPVNRTIIPLLQTAGLTWNAAYYELTATDGSGVVTQILSGVLTIQ